jgi:hypothetical protein
VVVEQAFITVGIRLMNLVLGGAAAVVMVVTKASRQEKQVPMAWVAAAAALQMAGQGQSTFQYQVVPVLLLSVIPLQMRVTVLL